MYARARRHGEAKRTPRQRDPSGDAPALEPDGQMGLTAEVPNTRRQVRPTARSAAVTQGSPCRSGWRQASVEVALSRGAGRPRRGAETCPRLVRRSDAASSIVAAPEDSELSGLNSAKATVVVPVYKPEPNPHEAVSWRRCLQIFASTPIIMVAPSDLDLAAYTALDPGRLPIHVVRFDPAYFRDTLTYSRLLLSPGFYEAFSAYEFILIHQLDAFVFRDELADWCERGYDYVGAPWIDLDWITDSRSRWPPETRDNLVGNGGFSLRRVAQALKLLLENPEVAERWGGSEDVFWSFLAGGCMPFTIPLIEEAVAFSFETRPARALELNGGNLPFGCHAWSHAATIDFWRPVLKGCGYDV